MPKKIVVAYSGGLDTSAIIPWLMENYDCEVIAYVGDVGQDRQDLVGIEEKAKKSGASACYVVDLQREFVRDYVYPMFLAGAMYEGRYLLGTSIARPVLAKAQVQVALDCGADAVCHGCTGKGNDQVRFEGGFAALAPHLEIIAPWRIWDMHSREDLLNYLKQRNIPCSASVEKIYSRDANLLHISHEGGELEDPWIAPPDDVWMMTSSVAQAPDEPADVAIAFDKGLPIAINDAPMQPEELLHELNVVAGRHGVGRVDIVENRLVGMKSRGCYETPGGTVLYEAMRALEELVLDRETLHFREQLGLKFAEMVYDGRWFTPLREAISTCVDTIAESMTGDVVVRLFKGHAVPVKRQSPNSLYAEDFATFGKDEVYNQADAGGFIRLFSLPSRIAAMKKSAPEKVTH